jgi:hypothetical protein
VDNGKVYLSQIFEWYRKDFGSSEAEVLAHVASYAEPGLKAQLRGVTRVADYSYDWSLNEAK